MYAKRLSLAAIITMVFIPFVVLSSETVSTAPIEPVDPAIYGLPDRMGVSKVEQARNQ
ncbi:MAG TPA: hypothetical protein PLQ56_28750 [Aggregatilineales bacterium]|nr:hypothetical protein [Aggregatilineales bacterium]